MTLHDYLIGASSPAPPASSASSGFSDDDSLHCDLGHGMSLGQFVESVRSRGRVGLVQDYAEIRARPPDGSFNHARYGEILFNRIQ
jgi:tyrosine-protein phosphatase non-receptor type 9